MKKLSFIILIIVLFVICINIWTNSVGYNNESKTYKILGVEDFNQYSLDMYQEMGGSESYGMKKGILKIKQQVKNNGDISIRTDFKSDSKVKAISNILLINGCKYVYKENNLFTENGEIKKESFKETYEYSEFEDIKSSFSVLSNKNFFWIKRTYEIIDGSLYYVEYFEDDFKILKVYIKKDEIKFLSFITEEASSSTEGENRYYIEKFSKDIDESQFNLP